MVKPIDIDDERFAALMRSDTLELTPEELSSGWHFCPEWDGLLVAPHTEEGEFCLCGIFAVSCAMCGWLGAISSSPQRCPECGKDSLEPRG